MAVADPGLIQGGTPTPKRAIIFQFFSRKLHENERICTPEGGGGVARPWRSPLDPPMHRDANKYLINSISTYFLLVKRREGVKDTKCLKSPFFWEKNFKK